MVSQLPVKSVPAKIPRIAVYLPSEEVKEELERLASAERRSLSQMAAILIEEGLERAKREGRIPPSASKAEEQTPKRS